MKIVTLLTDFGLKDSYVAEMKGVILSLLQDSSVNIIDLSHEVRPQNILEASFILSNSFYYFPEDSVHLVVVDPGVGTERDIIVVKTRHYIFIAPDNGVLYEAVNKDGIHKVRRIDIVKFRAYTRNLFRKNIVAEKVLSGKESKTFHGRDVFSPLAAYCIMEGYNEESFNKFSVIKDEILSIEKLKPFIRDNKIIGKVIYIDHFGNLITNIHHDLIKELIKDYKKAEIFIKLKENIISIGHLHSTYSDVEKGEPIALIGSRNYLELAVNCGSALKYFGVSGDEDVIVDLSR